MTDDMSFFHQATIKICGTLDIDKAMRDCTAYLEDHLPLDGLMLSTYEPERGAIRILAMDATVPTATWTPTQPTYLSSEARSYLQALGDDVFLYRKSETDPIASELNGPLGITPGSQIIMPLKADKKKLGVVLAFSMHSDIFDHRHVRLMKLLHDPFAIALSNVLRHREVLRLKNLLAEENRYLQQELCHISGDEIVGARQGLKDVMEMVQQVAPLNSHVMLTGETGVGKEVIANAIHYASPRREGPLVKVNCGAMPESLIDSELFGHEKGAFTGAIRSKRGRFERAHGGTLFLDEVGELPAAAQIRLLRVLQDGRIERIGGRDPIEVDVRIVAATHRNLSGMVRGGRFREDLWFRLNVFPIHIPPLRQRKSDIPALVHHFIDRKRKTFNLTDYPVLAPGAMEKLTAYAWPGNVRELENMVERALIRYHSRSETHFLRFDDLTTDLLDPPAPSRVDENLGRLPSLDEAMRQHIEKVLRSTNGRIQGENGAAAILDIHASTLRSRMQKLGMLFGRKAVQ